MSRRYSPWEPPPLDWPRLVVEVAVVLALAVLMVVTWNGIDQPGDHPPVPREEVGRER